MTHKWAVRSSLHYILQSWFNVFRLFFYQREIDEPRGICLCCLEKDNYRTNHLEMNQSEDKFKKLFFVPSRPRELSSRWSPFQARTHPWCWTRSLSMDRDIPDPPPCLCSLAMEGIPCRDRPSREGLDPCSLRWAKVAASPVWVGWAAWDTRGPTWSDPGWWPPTSPWGSSCSRGCRDSRYNNRKFTDPAVYMKTFSLCSSAEHSHWKNYKYRCYYKCRYVD